MHNATRMRRMLGRAFMGRVRAGFVWSQKTRKTEKEKRGQDKAHLAVRVSALFALKKNRCVAERNNVDAHCSANHPELPAGSAFRSTPFGLPKRLISGTPAHNWFALSKADQKTVPEAALLQAIDEEYDRCVRAGARIVRRLRSVPATSAVSAAAKLSVVAEIVDPEDYPAAYRVLLAAISDLRAIRRDG